MDALFGVGSGATLCRLVRPQNDYRNRLTLPIGVQASDSYDATIETLKAIPHQASKQIQVLVEMCAFAGTGNVLRVQTMLQQCGEHLNTKDAVVADSEQEGDKKAETKQDDTFQAFAVLGIALVAMGEDIGAEMSLRQFNHLVCTILFLRVNHQHYPP